MFEPAWSSPTNFSRSMNANRSSETWPNVSVPFVFIALAIFELPERRMTHAKTVFLTPDPEPGREVVDV